MTRTEVAREAGLSPSTLAKFWNDTTGAARLELSSIRKLEQRFGIRLDGFERSRLAALPPLTGFHENEADPFVGASSSERLARAVEALIGEQAGVVAWQLTSSALTAGGYLPGDVLIVDLNATARDGDVVCAQLYDRVNHASTVFRLYQKPFLTAPASLIHKPLIVDDDAVAIRGVVIASLRARHAAHLTIVGQA